MSVVSVETYAETDADGNDVLFTQRYDEAHNKVGGPIQVTSSEVSASASSTLLLSNGGFVVAYNFVDPTDTSTPYPFAYLETREFSPDGTLLATNLIGQNDLNKTASVDSVALAGGAYASVIGRSEGYANGSTLRETVQYTDAAGHSTEKVLYTESFSDVPYPQLDLSDPVLKVLGNGNFSVSYTGKYTEGSPEYSPPHPYPTGTESFQEVYRPDGSLVSKTFIDFGHATDLFSTTVTAKLADNLFNLTLLGNDRISGTGNAHDNILSGNSNKNHLVGLAGDDRLDGGLGTDYLQGGVGHDTFVFSTTIKGIFNSDLIADFTHGEDKIELSSKIFTSLAPGQLAAADFADPSAGPANPDAHIRYDIAGNLSFDPDGAGSAPGYQFATLAGHPTLTASDFLIV